MHYITIQGKGRMVLKNTTLVIITFFTPGHILRAVNPDRLREISAPLSVLSFIRYRFLMAGPRFSIATCLLCLIFFITLMFPLAEKSNAAVTIQDEKKIGKELYDKLKKNNFLIEDDRITEYVTRIGNILLKQGRSSPFDFTFSVVKSSGINAFATPGGYVYVYAGLIKVAEDECQLAGVLAHEIAHVKARHIAKIIEKSKKISLATAAAILAGAFIGGDAAAAVSSFSMAAASTLQLKYSRKHEEEADTFGMGYLVAAGYDGQAMPEFLSIMRRYDYYSSAVPSYFLTHPGTNERLTYLDQLLHTKYTERGERCIVGSFDRIKTLLVLTEKNNILSNIRLFEDVISSNPHDVDALYGLAVLQNRVGESDKSITTFQKALTITPDDADILKDLGITYFHRGKTKRAIETLRHAYAIGTYDCDTLYYLGRSFEARKNYDAALSVYKILHTEYPDHTDVLYNMAMCYGKMNHTGESHYYFGRFFHKKGKRKSALFHYRAARSALPQNSQQAQDLETHIDTLTKAEKDKKRTDSQKYLIN